MVHQHVVCTLVAETDRRGTVDLLLCFFTCRNEIVSLSLSLCVWAAGYALTRLLLLMISSRTCVLIHDCRRHLNEVEIVTNCDEATRDRDEAKMRRNENHELSFIYNLAPNAVVYVKISV